MQPFVQVFWTWLGTRITKERRVYDEPWEQQVIHLLKVGYSDVNWLVHGQNMKIMDLILYSGSYAMVYSCHLPCCRSKRRVAQGTLLQPIVRRLKYDIRRNNNLGVMVYKWCVCVQWGHDTSTTSEMVNISDGIYHAWMDAKWWQIMTTFKCYLYLYIYI